MKKLISLFLVLCFIPMFLTGCTGGQAVYDWIKAPVIKTNDKKVIYNGNTYSPWDYNATDYAIPVFYNELNDFQKRFVGRARFVGSYYIVFEEKFDDAILFYTQYTQWFLKDGYEFPDPFSLNVSKISIIKGTQNLITIKDFTKEEPLSLEKFIDVENSLPFGSGISFTDTGYSLQVEISGYNNLKLKSKFILKYSENLYFNLYAHEKTYKISNEYQDDIRNAINAFENINQS